MLRISARLPEPAVQIAFVKPSNGSELIINALKHGYPRGTGGTIRVTLRNASTGLSLEVENDGVDFASDCPANEGSPLLDRLSAVLGASIERGSGSMGHGYRVGARVWASEEPSRKG
jgi:two-component sensor histidine kinase